MSEKEQRLAIQRALLSLRGLSVGDAFGETFFIPSPEVLMQRLSELDPPPPPWGWTDDTQMALSIVDGLATNGRIDPDHLASAFTERFDSARGYGGGATRLFDALRSGGDWRELTPAMFGGKGSFGNGAAMRVAPVGAYFADDLPAAVKNAALSAAPTHSHPEGEAGAVAVAVAAALAWRVGEGEAISPEQFLAAVIEQTPAGETRRGIEMAAGLPDDTHPVDGAQKLGSGNLVSSQDTVPFALWCAAGELHNYPAALWFTAMGLGDVDTTCAIVGGIVALSARERGVPPDWLAAREPLPSGFEI